MIPICLVCSSQIENMIIFDFYGYVLARSKSILKSCGFVLGTICLLLIYLMVYVNLSEFYEDYWFQSIQIYPIMCAKRPISSNFEEEAEKNVILTTYILGKFKVFFLICFAFSRRQDEWLLP